MATYEYACAGCGTFEVARPLGTAPPEARCPDCGEAAPRRLSIPAFTAPNAPARRARERADASAHEPAVASRPPPPPRRRSRPANPLHAKLPRP